MSYILFYEMYEYGDNGAYWEDKTDQYETYSELIEDCADMIFKYGNEIELHSIFKIDNNMLDLFSGDIIKRVDEMKEEKEKKILIEKRQREEREALMEEEYEAQEYALYQKLHKKYWAN